MIEGKPPVAAQPEVASYAPLGPSTWDGLFGKEIVTLRLEASKRRWREGVLQLSDGTTITVRVVLDPVSGVVTLNGPGRARGTLQLSPNQRGMRGEWRDGRERVSISLLR